MKDSEYLERYAQKKFGFQFDHTTHFDIRLVDFSMSTLGSGAPVVASPGANGSTPTPDGKPHPRPVVPAPKGLKKIVSIGNFNILFRQEVIFQFYYFFSI